MREAALLDGLDDAQRHAVTTASRPLVIRAAAGSGKTRVLTRRLAYRAAAGDLDPRRALCVTFTREAAGELRSRLRALGLRDLPAAGTFHAVALSMMRARWHDRRMAEPSVTADRAGLVRRVAPSVDPLRLRAVVAEIDWARARGVGPERYPAAAQRAGRRSNGIEATAVARIYGDYEAAKRQRRVVDFDDLLERCAEALERDPAFAAAQRWRFHHLFVDEFQDVNPLQFRLLRAWLGEGNDLCVVGDPRQAIYGWNGADPTLIERVSTLLPGGEVVHLAANHRSSPQVVAVAGAALGVERSERPRPADHRSAGPVPVVVPCGDEAHEVATIADLVRRANDRGIAWRDQAVLVRTNDVAQRLREGLAQRGVPVARSVRGRADPGALLPDVATWADLLEALTDPALEALVPLAAEYADLDARPTPRGFAAWLRTVDGPWAGARDRLAVSTFHAAKGREWRAVVVAAVEDGFVPVGGGARAGSAAEAEERRLFYVALSRAGELLACTWAASRAMKGSTVARQPSPYLAAVAEECARLEAADAPVAPPPLRLAATRHPALGDDQAARRMDALRAWRRTQARAAAVAPAAVLADATLATLAATPPADLGALAAVAGVGPLRAARFGPAVLAALGADTDVEPAASDGRGNG